VHGHGSTIIGVDLRDRLTLPVHLCERHALRAVWDTSWQDRVDCLRDRQARYVRDERDSRTEKPLRA
jgi:hypothetical protein